MTLKNANIELHTHPYFENYGLEAILQAMKKNGLDIIALEYLNKPCFPDVLAESKKLKNLGYIVNDDEIAIQIEKDKQSFYILKALEIHTKENFHLLSIGYDDLLPFSPMQKMIDTANKYGAITIFDHPIVDNNAVWRNISKQKQKEVIQICYNNSNQLALEWNGYCEELYWNTVKLFGKKNVNEEVLMTSLFLQLDYNSNNPVVTDTDIHARQVGALSAIGTARIITDIDTSSGYQIIQTMKESIFQKNHTNTCKTVSLPHFIQYFALPYLTNKAINVFNRPRG
jgi:hypothetical protein